MADDDDDVTRDIGGDDDDEPQTNARAGGGGNGSGGGNRADSKTPPKSADGDSGSAGRPGDHKRNDSKDTKSGGGGGGGGGASGVKSPTRLPLTNQPLNANLIALKVALVGPKQSGKTLIANQLSGFGEPAAAAAGGAGGSENERYDPTVGVRILEFESDITGRSRDGKQSANTKVLVELWDCSGDPKYEGCWPTITKDLLGICIVFDPKSKSHTAEIKAWCEWFTKNADLDSQQCVLLAHGNLNTNHPNFGPIKTGKKTVSIPVVNINTVQAQSGDGSKKPSSAQLAFRHFLGDCYAYHRLAHFE